MKYRFLAIDNERMTRIVAALESDNGVRALGKKVDDRPLTLVTPLGADNNNVLAQTQPRTKYNKPRPAITSPRPQLRN